jgi:GDPmannose 4,6-dehydratase
MWQMLQRDAPEDFLIASGETHSVAELCETAFGHLDLDYREYVVQDPTLVRAPEGAQLVGNPEKAHRVLGWHPKVDFRTMIQRMVDADLARPAPA